MTPQKLASKLASRHFESSIKAPHICIPKECPPPDTPYSGNNAHCAPDRTLALLMIADPSHNNLTPVSNASCTLSANCYRAPVPPGHWHTHARHECAYTTRCSLSPPSALCTELLLLERTLLPRCRPFSPIHSQDPPGP